MHSAAPCTRDRNSVIEKCHASDDEKKAEAHGIWSPSPKKLMTQKYITRAQLIDYQWLHVAMRAWKLKRACCFRETKTFIRTELNFQGFFFFRLWWHLLYDTVRPNFYGVLHPRGSREFILRIVPFTEVVCNRQETTVHSYLSVLSWSRNIHQTYAAEKLCAWHHVIFGVGVRVALLCFANGVFFPTMKSGDRFRPCLRVTCRRLRTW